MQRISNQLSVQYDSYSAACRYAIPDKPDRTIAPLNYSLLKFESARPQACEYSSYTDNVYIMLTKMVKVTATT